MSRTTILLLTCAVGAVAYVPNPYDAVQLNRLDYAGMQFFANQNIAAGMTNASGTVWITPDSAPMSAISGAIGAWNSVSTTAARFLPIQSTSLIYNPLDGNCVIVFVDDAFSESVTGGVIAFTDLYYNTGNGEIQDSDIVFSPAHQFSTTGAPGTYDIQAILTHELGHAMGANHTNVLSATMYYSTAMQDTHQQTLSQDDMAFVSALYPPAVGNGYGRLTGAATVNGLPLTGGAITAVDAFTGITIGGLSSTVDGSFSVEVPPGNYYIYVEPAVNLSLYASPNSQAVIFTSFQAAFAGGNDQAAIIGVQAGITSSANLNATAGLTPLKAPYAAIGAAGMLGDVSSISSGSLTVSSGQSVDFVFSDPLTGAIAESNIQAIGPATLHAGSLRKDVVSLSDGTPVYRFTLDIPPLAANSAETLVFRNGVDIVTRTGVLNLTLPQPVNASGN